MQQGRLSNTFKMKQSSRDLKPIPRAEADILRFMFGTSDAFSEAHIISAQFLPIPLLHISSSRGDFKYKKMRVSAEAWCVETILQFNLVSVLSHSYPHPADMSVTGSIIPTTFGYRMKFCT